VRDALAWKPDACFSHNMSALRVDEALAARVPVVKMMHGYFGTCIGGEKVHKFPSMVACVRRFGIGCAALYLPRHCGSWSVGALSEQYAWARAQQGLFARYAAVVVASEHMRREYAGNGVPEQRLTVARLFATAGGTPHAGVTPDPFRVLFVGRMTAHKGGDALVRAIAHAQDTTGVRISATFVGDGPQRADWSALAERVGVEAEFTGWLDERSRDAQYQQAALIAVPSVWPEPFGLVGLEAGAFGVPAVAFDVGGIGEWLRDGHNGWLVPAAGGARALGAAIAAAVAERGALQAFRLRAWQVAQEMSRERHLDVIEHLLSRASNVERA
jgi:glycosyltransferase involved in cell wall biosynthesis